MLTHYNIERKLSTRHMLVGYCTAHSLLFFFFLFSKLDALYLCYFCGLFCEMLCSPLKQLLSFCSDVKWLDFPCFSFQSEVLKCSTEINKCLLIRKGICYLRKKKAACFHAQEHYLCCNCACQLAALNSKLVGLCCTMHCNSFSTIECC